MLQFSISDHRELEVNTSKPFRFDQQNTIYFTFYKSIAFRRVPNRTPFRQQRAK